VLTVTPRGPVKVLWRKHRRQLKTSARPAECEQETRGEHPPHDAEWMPDPAQDPARIWTATGGFGVRSANRQTTRSIRQHRRIPKQQFIAIIQHMLQQKWHHKAGALPTHAAVAQLAARRSHNPKVGSSILSCRISGSAQLETGRRPRTSK
jgi:hypothetical protein